MIISQTYYKVKAKRGLLVILILFSYNCIGQNLDFEGFKITQQVKSTEIKDQYMSPTCWSFATISFIESELLRVGVGEFDLSEMFVVHQVYQRKAVQNYRMHGYNFFTGGGQPRNVMITIKQKGIVPEAVYSGKRCNVQHDHTKLDYETEQFVNAMDSLQGKELPENWKDSFDLILDKYLGKLPRLFTYQNKAYNSRTFVDSVLNINPDDYIDITSFTHHPFYSAFCLESRYNWEQQLYYNVPLNEFVNVIENALFNGYSVCWNGDVSEVGFSPYKGIAELELKSKVSQSMRQRLFDNHSTTIDHVMHLIGKAKNKNDEIFYLIKNSWGTFPNNGYLMMSADYLKLKTVSIMVHKDAIPENIRKKLNL